jgi:hypothetical protein
MSDTDIAFRNAVLLGIFKQSSILNNIETNNLNYSQMQDLISRDHAQNFNELKIVLSKTVVKWLLSLGQNALQVKYLPVENIQTTITADERLYLIEHEGEQPKNIFYIVAKNIACDLFLEQLKSFISIEDKNLNSSSNKVQIQTTNEEPKLQPLPTKNTYTFSPHIETLPEKEIPNNGESQAIDLEGKEKVEVEQEKEIVEDQLESELDENKIESDEESVVEFDEEDEEEKKNDNIEPEILEIKRKREDDEDENQIKKRKQTFEINDLFL